MRSHQVFEWSAHFVADHFTKPVVLIEQLIVTLTQDSKLRDFELELLVVSNQFLRINRW